MVGDGRRRIRKVPDTEMVLVSLVLGNGVEQGCCCFCWQLLEMQYAFFSTQGCLGTKGGCKAHRCHKAHEAKWLNSMTD